MNKILTLSKQTNVVKSQLRHDQLKNGTYFYNSFKNLQAVKLTLLIKGSVF